MEAKLKNKEKCDLPDMTRVGKRRLKRASSFGFVHFLFAFCCLLFILGHFSADYQCAGVSCVLSGVDLLAVNIIVQQSLLNIYCVRIYDGSLCVCTIASKADGFLCHAETMIYLQQWPREEEADFSLKSEEKDDLWRVLRESRLTKRMHLHCLGPVCLEYNSV